MDTFLRDTLCRLDRDIQDLVDVGFTMNLVEKV